jgi:microcystin degradation protein MlrC
MKRVGIAGFLHESNTFLHVPTTYQLFQQASLTVGNALLERWRGTHHELGGFIAGAEDFGFEPVPLMATYAMPSGALTGDTFDRIAGELLASLEAALPLDGVLLALHGATVAENFPDADGEILRRFRAALGPDVPLINTLDLHANVSQQMIAHANATVMYRSCPHLDQRDRGREAAQILMRTMAGEIRPVQWLEAPPLLINMGRQYTGVSPARELYADAEETARQPGMISASIAMGFYFADVAEMGASFLAVADGDMQLARTAARRMADRAWNCRGEFQIELPSVQEAVRLAGESGKTPVVLMDVGDNVGGGSPGDSTILLAEILRQQFRNSLVVLYDPAAARACAQAGVRRSIELDAGGKTDDRHGAPVRIRGRIRTLSDGLFFETQVRHGGWGAGDQGLTAVIETEEQHTIVLTSHRMAPMSLEQILSLGIKPERKQMIVVKGVVAPRAAYEPIAAEIILADTPGATSADPSRFAYEARRKPLFPLELDARYR